MAVITDKFLVMKIFLSNLIASKQKSKHEADYELVRAKRRFEKLLRSEGMSIKDAKKQVAEQFSNNHTHERI